METDCVAEKDSKKRKLYIDPELIEKENRDKIKYVYFGHEKSESNKNNGVVCMAYSYNKKDKTIVYCVALCSPSDIFSKKKAKEIIRSRMEDGNTITITFDTYNNPTRRQAIYMILHHIRFYANAKQLGLGGCKPKWMDKLLDDVDV